MVGLRPPRRMEGGIAWRGPHGSGGGAPGDNMDPPPFSSHSFSSPTLISSPCRQQNPFQLSDDPEVSRAVARDDVWVPTFRIWDRVSIPRPCPTLIFPVCLLWHIPMIKKKIFFLKRLVTVWLFNFPFVLNCVLLVRRAPGEEGAGGHEPRPSRLRGCFGVCYDFFFGGGVSATPPCPHCLSPSGALVGAWMC